jgi:mannose-6-phosphate isomerase-like protein (cupin superfamily)
MTKSLGNGISSMPTPPRPGAAFELFETGESNAGEGPTAHVHQERDEAFYVLQGWFGIWCGEDTIEAGPGEFVFVPRGSRHRFEARVDGSRLLFIVAPAGLEGYFREKRQLIERGVAPRDASLDLASRYDVSFPTAPTA